MRRGREEGGGDHIRVAPRGTRGGRRRGPTGAGADAAARGGETPGPGGGRDTDTSGPRKRRRAAVKFDAFSWQEPATLAQTRGRRPPPARRQPRSGPPNPTPPVLSPGKSPRHSGQEPAPVPSATLARHWQDPATLAQTRGRRRHPAQHPARDCAGRRSGGAPALRAARPGSTRPSSTAARVPGRAGRSARRGERGADGPRQGSDRSRRPAPRRRQPRPGPPNPPSPVRAFGASAGPSTTRMWTVPWATRTRGSGQAAGPRAGASRARAGCRKRRLARPVRVAARRAAQPASCH